MIGQEGKLIRRHFKTHRSSDLLHYVVILPCLNLYEYRFEVVESGYHSLIVLCLEVWLHRETENHPECTIKSALEEIEVIRLEISPLLSLYPLNGTSFLILSDSIDDSCDQILVFLLVNIEEI